MCDQAWTAAMRLWTELQEIAFSEAIDICAEVNFTYPSTTHSPAFKAPYSVYQKHRDREYNVFFFFFFWTEIPRLKKKSQPLLYVHLAVLIRREKSWGNFTFSKNV